MSWLFSRALVEEYLGANSLDGEPSALSSGKPTPLAYCAPDKMKAYSRLSRYGVTFVPLTEDLGEVLLKSFRGAFPVRTLVLREKAMDSMENEVPCGTRWRGWLAKFDPNSSLWRTAQCSLLEEESESLQTLPRWGMTQSGWLWELPMLAHHTNATEYGFTPKMPTPNAWDGKRGPMSKELMETGKHQVSLVTYVKHNPERFPTPTASDHKEQPTSASWKAKGGVNYKLSNPEIRAKWGTPKAQDSRHALTDRGKGNLGEQVSGLHNGGKLNPQWVEWLMGYPIGWTGLLDAEMDKSPSAQQPLGES